MIRFYGVSAFVAAWLASMASAGAQETRTQAPCSPVIDRTQGSVTLNFSGGCTVGITPAQLKDIIDSVLAGRAIPPELLDRYEGISRQFGVTDTAVTNFFRILGANKVAIEDLDAKLREIAARHLTLLKQTETQGGDDPQVAALKKEAAGAIGAGDYARAQTLLQQAFDADLAAARKAQDVANQRYVTAARTKAEQGQLKLTQLQYAAAAEEFKTAADLVPAGEPLIRAEYLAALGRVAYHGGNYRLAGTALAEALSIREKALSPDDANLANSLNDLALLYGEQGRYAEAEPLYKRALAIGEKALGPEHPDVAIDLNNLAALYYAGGRYADAEPLYKRALAIGEKMLGPEHPDVAIRLSNLAVLYHTQGRTAQAEPLYKRSLAIVEKVLGPEHPSVATDLNNLAALYKAQGRYADAEPLYKRALAIDEKVLGPEHPSVATYLNNLALLYWAQGRATEAEPLHKRALAIAEKMLGPQHPNVAGHLTNLADLYRKQGRTAEAAPLYQRALAIDEKVFGPEHPTTKSVRRNLEMLQQSAAPSTETRPAKHRR